MLAFAYSDKRSSDCTKYSIIEVKEQVLESLAAHPAALAEDGSQVGFGGQQSAVLHVADHRHRSAGLSRHSAIVRLPRIVFA